MFVQLKSSVKNEPQKAPSTTMSRAVTRELLSSSVYKRQQRDLTSSKLNVKGPKQAEALQVAEIHDLRRQLTLLPIDLKEDARINYQLTLMNNQRSLQDFQCRMLANVEALLKSEMTERGEDHRKYRIGGHEDATYERFFRIEPSRFMSKPQFTTALRMVFGENMIKSAPMINKLYESFDLRRVNEMDWRSMLYLLNLLMQPTLPCIEHIKIGYSLYSSVGCLDSAGTEKLVLGVLKDLLATPVQLSMRPTLTTDMDLAWQQLMQNDEQIILYSAKAAERHQKRDTTGKGFDPNELKIPFRMFLKILTETSMQRYFEVATVFGRKDPRPWSYRLEETFYHPILLQRIKALRREYRNEDIATWFLAQQNYRKKRFMYTTWVDYVRRRTKLRVVLIAAEIRATIANYHVFFNHIRKVCMEYRAAVQCQRLIRGFISRQRRHFIKRLQRKVVKMQSSTRQYLKRLSFSRQKMRLYWAAVTIQRVVRGRVARVRVGTIVQAIYDQRVRQLAKDRATWMMRRMTRAMMCIKRYWHRYVKRKKMMEAMRLRDLEEEISEEMQRVQEEARIAWELYKLALSQWYEERKIRYDEDVLTELHTKEQRKLLIERRAKLANEIKLRKKQEHDARLAKLEEEQIEFWIKNWEETIIKRGDQRRQKCRNALRLPETPEEILLKKDIAKRTKAHIKDVLRRADMQKIPMEIPEAFNIAQDEIIEEEVQSAMAQARQEMKDDGMRIEEEKRRKAEQQRLEEIAEKQRKAKWAAVTIQTYARVYLARRTVRHKAYERYAKFFDRAFHEYYYQDNVTKQCFWSKPKSLGSYDIVMEDYWLVLPLRRPEAEAAAAVEAPTYHNMPTAPVVSDNPVGIEKTFETFYFYQPSTWKQTWVQPEYTVLCALCQAEFAQHYVHWDYQCYCTPCMQKQVYEVWTQPTGESPGATLRDIVFQNFNGGRTDASYMDMTAIAVQDFYTFIMKLDPSLQMSAAEEEEDNRRAHIQKRRKRLSQELHHCLHCKQQIATMFCPECPKHRCIFCGDCDGHVHRKGRKKLHKRQRLLLEQARSALKAAAEELEKPAAAAQQSKLPSIGRLGKSMMTSMFGKSGFFGKDDADGDDSDDDSDGSSDGDPRRRGMLGRQGSTTKLPAILPANAEGQQQLQRQVTQRIDGQESSSASSDSEATKERKAKEKARLAKEAARQERLKRKKQQREAAAAAEAAAGAAAEGAAAVESTSDGETPVGADGGAAVPQRKPKDGAKTKKKKKKQRKSDAAAGDASETDAASSATGGTETSQKKRKKPKKTKASAVGDESNTPTATDAQRLPVVQQQQRQPAYDGVTNSGRMDVDTQRPFSSPEPESKPRRVKSKKSPKNKPTSSSSGNGGGGGGNGEGLKLPPITSERSRTAPAALTDSTPQGTAPLDGTDRPASDMDEEAAPRRPKQKKKTKTTKKTKAAAGSDSDAAADADPAKVYDAGDESSVFTHGDNTPGDDGAVSSGRQPTAKERKKKKKKQQTTDAAATGLVDDDGTAVDSAPSQPQEKGTKKKKKKKKTKPNESGALGVSDTDVSQLTMDDSDFRDTRDSDFSDHAEEKPRAPRHVATASANAAVEEEEDNIGRSSSPEKTKKPKKPKKPRADDNDNGGGDPSMMMAMMDDGGSEPSTAAAAAATKKKKKKRTKPTADGSEAEGAAGVGEYPTDEQPTKKKKTKKTKKVISGVLAGLGGDASDMDSSLATGLASTASSQPKKTKKPKKARTSSGDGGDNDDDGDGYLSGSTAFASDASSPTPKTKKKKKKKKPSGEVSSDGDFLMSDGDAAKDTKKKSKKSKKKTQKAPTVGGDGFDGFGDGGESSGYLTESTGQTKKKKKKNKKKTHGGDAEGFSSGGVPSSPSSTAGSKSKTKKKKKKADRTSTVLLAAFDHMAI